MIDFLIKSSLSLFVFLCFYHLVLEREKTHHFNRFYLLFSIVLSFAIPFMTFEIIKIVPVETTFEPIINPIASTEIPKNETEIIHGAPTVKMDYTPYIISLLYGLPTLLLLGRFGKNIRKLISKKKTNPRIRYKNAYLVLVKEKTLPHTFFNAIFINIEDYQNQTIEEELYTHELAHVTQKHTWDILFIEFLKTIFWFNPILVYYKKAIQLNHEFLADQTSVEKHDNIPVYQNLLLMKSSSLKTIYLASNLNYQVTKKRLVMMTKKTSKRRAVVKKIAVLPIIAGLILCLCFKVVAQEKPILSTKKYTDYSEAEKDKIRDAYYSNVWVILTDERNGLTINKKYEDLTLAEKRTYLNWVPDMYIEKEIPEALFEKLTTKENAVWINNKISSKDEIKKHKRTDFAYYSYSFVHKNARTKRYPQEYQYTLYTQDFFNTNMKNSHLHFSGDTLKLRCADKDTAKKNKLFKKIKTDTLVWYTTQSESNNEPHKDKKEKKIIVIDAGHGGHDFGATQEEWIEKNLTSEIAKKINEMVADPNIEIHFTRTSDEFMDLKSRSAYINGLKADLVLSLHINQNKNNDTNGFEVFICEKNSAYEESKVLGEKLVSKLSNTELKNRGVKNAPFWILKNANCPSLVVELGFISNEKDRKFISSKKGQSEIATQIIAFLSAI